VLALLALISPALLAPQATSEVTTDAPGAATDESGDGSMVTLGAVGLKVAIDPETGRLRKLTSEESRGLGLGLQKMLSRSTEGLQPVYRGNGMVSLDLQGRFMSVSVARISDDGHLETDCVYGLEAAEAFLAGDQPAPGVETPVSLTPAREEQ
jgi:hypothetical protein